MKSDEFKPELLARYVAGEYTEQERKKIEQWLNKHPDNEKKMEEFKRIWDVTKNKQQSIREMFDRDKNWQNLKARLKEDGDFEQPASEPAYASTSRSRITPLHSVTQKIIRVAAIFLIAGLVGVLAYQNWYQPEPEAQDTVLREISTANAQRANLTLNDGTEVMLNAASNLQLPTEFEEDVREVFLKGEAYFDVSSDPDKPFLIHARGSVIRVLGTSFTVRSYPEDGQVQVVVEEGRVSLTPEDQKSGEQAILNVNELGRYNLNSQRIETKQVEDLQLYMSWREGYLKFRETPMSQVASELERRYGVEVTFESPEIEEKLLTAYLTSRSIKNVLSVISESLEIEFQLDADQVTFSKE